MAAPLPLILRNTSLLAPIPSPHLPLRLCNTHSHHHTPLSRTKPFSVISVSSTNTRSFPILNSTKVPSVLFFLYLSRRLRLTKEENKHVPLQLIRKHKDKFSNGEPSGKAS